KQRPKTLLSSQRMLLPNRYRNHLGCEKSGKQSDRTQETRSLAETNQSSAGRIGFESAFQDQGQFEGTTRLVPGPKDSAPPNGNAVVYLLDHRLNQSIAWQELQEQVCCSGLVFV